MPNSTLRARAERVRASAEAARARADAAAHALEQRSAWLRQVVVPRRPPRPPTPRLGVRLAIDGDAMTIGLSGDLDLDSRGALDDLFAQIVAFAPARVIVDLGDLDHIDVSGMNALCAFRRQLAPGGVRLVRALPIRP
jgi:ABC-type transporter Mla MlaB component